MKCYRDGGCGPYEMYSCSECPASKPEYLKPTVTEFVEKQETKLDELKKSLLNMTAEEIVEYFGGDSCENALCKFVGDQGCCCRNSDRYDSSKGCKECIEGFLRMRV